MVRSEALLQAERRCFAHAERRRLLMQGHACPTATRPLLPAVSLPACHALQDVHPCRPACHGWQRGAHTGKSSS